MIKRIFGIVLLTLAIVSLSYLVSNTNKVQAVVSDWGACVSTGAQCGTDNGTQSKTVYANYTGVCGVGYHYQNTGNFNQRCHRNNDCDWYHDRDLICPVENKTPTGITCPEGYVKSGDAGSTVCSQVQTRDCQTGVKQYDSCTKAGECPTTCGLEASRVPDGQGGYLSCPATSSCPDPISTPSATTGGNPPTFAGSSTNAPVCGDGNTVQLPANAHVVRSGSEATVNFFITEGDSANIYYRVVGQIDWQYSVADVKPNADNFVSYTIQGLDPQLGYDFGVQQKTNCGGGFITGVIIDGPQSQTFRVSYWTF